MSWSRGTSDFDSFDLSFNDQGYNQRFPYTYVNSKFPSYQAAGPPCVYYAQITKTNCTARSTKLELPQIKPKKKKRSCFSKAFNWYSKERDLGFKNGGKKKIAESETADLSGFATWLDIKYQEFILERENSAYKIEPNIETTDNRNAAISYLSNQTSNHTHTINSDIPSTSNYIHAPTCCSQKSYINHKERTAYAKRMVDCLCRDPGSSWSSGKPIEYLPCTGYEDNYWSPDVCPSTLTPCYDAKLFIEKENNPCKECSLRKNVTTSTEAVSKVAPVIYKNLSTMAGQSQLKQPSINSIAQTSQHAIQMPKTSYPLFLKVIKADKLTEEKQK